MHAALQQPQGTIAASAKMSSRAVIALDACSATGGRLIPAHATMSAAAPRQFKIQGITREGKAFRPSDWAERLAGALSSFRPGGGTEPNAHIGYSPYCVPRVVGGVKCVIVNEALRGLEPMAMDFVMNFARDNALVVSEIAAGEDLS
jgi:Protein of unknown function (DUF3579)